MAYRSRILEIIEASREHPTAEQIYLQMKETGSGIVLASVYNNLTRLLDEGKIRKVSVEGQPDRYDRTARHDHLVCRKCGRLSDICFPDLMPQLRAQTTEEILSYDLRISYICPECRQSSGTGDVK